MHNRARVVRGSCKILSRNIHYKHARMPIDFQRTDNVKRAASYNTAALQNMTSLQSTFIPQMQLHYETCRHKTPRAKQLCRAVHDPSVFGVC
ncbi:hypothetical protein, partial [uncultured Campylobacter sp.]|uniref:hypothetical protein n=1 Tax=uncultured Campylobacter sp. TaxID=218934 RepID=UPI0026094E19